MCGIAGMICYNSGPSEKLVERMTRSLAHRGPNAHGIKSFDRAVLGHRRLSILDLNNRSNQPLMSEDGRFCLVFNGEIYNYKELRKSLEQHVEFHTESDTEVVLNAFIHYGSACVHKFDGMFAFGIWDNHEESIFLARDPYGIKPLYVGEVEGGMYFSSELRPLMLAGFKTLNRTVLGEYARYQSVQSPETLLKGVQVLRAGAFMEFSNQQKTHQRYRSTLLPASEAPKEPENDVADLLRKSVEKRLIADVPIATFLSGGIDSSVISLLASELSQKKPTAFSVGFDDSSSSELSQAQSFARDLGLPFHPINVSPEQLLDQLPQAFAAMDTPTGDGINSFVISNLVSTAGFRVALSGLGGDELFFGYSNVFFDTYKWYTSSALQMFRKPIYHILKKRDFIGAQKWLEIAHVKSLKEAYLARRAVLPNNIVNDLGNWNLEAKQIKLKTTRSQLSVFELDHYLEPTLLRDTDQMSMANGLEVRVPMLDNALVKYVVGLKDELKMGKVKKPLLEKAFGRSLPPDLFDRPKVGFTFPWDEWVKGPLRSFTETRLTSLGKRGIFNEEQLKRLSDLYFVHGKISWSRIWHFVALEEWIVLNQVEIEA